MCEEPFAHGEGNVPHSYFPARAQTEPQRSSDHLSLTWTRYATMVDQIIRRTLQKNKKSETLARTPSRATLTDTSGYRR